MKKIFLFLLFLSLVLIGQDMNCGAPSNIMNVVKPNVLFLWDITGSMLDRAYWDENSRILSRYNPNIIYYGYFHPDSIYEYKNSRWQTTGLGANGDYRVTLANFNYRDLRILGNILNWAIMSRMDIAKKVLAGGKGVPASDYINNLCRSEGATSSGNGWPTETLTLVNNPSITYVFKRGNNDNTSTISIDSIHNNIRRGTKSALQLDIDVRTLDTLSRVGIFTKIADKDFDRKWDGGDQVPRFALITFSATEITLQSGFSKNDSGGNAADFTTAIKNAQARGLTNVGDAIIEALHYFKFTSRMHFQNKNWDADPYIRKISGNKYDTLWCSKSFVVLIGDGESNTDTRITTTDYTGTHSLPYGPRGNYNLCSYNNNLTGFDSDPWDSVNHACDCTDCGGTPLDNDHPADDYAYYGHITDLGSRTTYNLPGKQNLTFYTIFTFGSGADLFKSIAKWGGFKDKNMDNLPQRSEYDADNNGSPDNYYVAQDGFQFESAIKKIIYEIMATVSSGTATAIVATGTRGEGIGTYAVYYPKKFFGTTEIDWIGMLHGVWVDPYGNLREETEGNYQLHLKNDFVIQMAYDTATGTTKISRYRDVNGDNKNLQFVDIVNYENLNKLFDLGEYLKNISPANRNIFTFINGTEREFKTSNRNIIRPFLDVKSDGEADTVINYIRGTDFPNLRSRTLPDGKVYKLGDIVYSSPLVVGPPMERYDLLYGDTSYMSYFKKYSIDEKRRSVVYVGANDGMLHCVNIGIYNSDSGKVAGYLDPAGHTPGKELWAYIPFNLLPHLKWLKDPEYCHLYYVDLKPYPTDVKIFNADNTHVNGWGTILISGFRLGGTKYILPGGTTLSSGYACIDVTNPLSPDVLWEWRIPEFTYSTSYPNVIKVQNSWYMIVGTGPFDYDGSSLINAKIYVINLQNGTTVGSFTIPEARSAIGDIISVDLDLDYSVDLIYFGTYYDPVGNTLPADYRGYLYRLNTRESPNIANWNLTKVFGPTRPITAAPAVTLDEQGKLWIYFGTGKYFTDADESDLTPEYFYGIKDVDTSSTISLASLQNVTNVRIYGADSVIGIPGVKTFTEFENYMRTKSGWYRVLTKAGEKSFTRPYVLGGTTIFTTFKPTGDICRSGGVGYIYAVYYTTGTGYKKPILEKNPITGEHVVSEELGPGMPAEPSLYVGPTDEKVFVQISGAVTEINQINLAIDPRGGLIMWKRR